MAQQSLTLRTAFGPPLLLPGLCVLVLVALLAELLLGAVAITPERMLGLLLGAPATPREMAVLWQIRLPRGLLALSIGAALGLAGAAQQGLFRNPLADPSLIGVSAGAALAAVTAIVFGGRVDTGIAASIMVPLAAFAGGLLATLIVLRLAQAVGGDESTGGLLLAGIAVNAVCAAGTGLLITVSDDRQLRDIIFWTLGSLATGGWRGGIAAGFCTLLALAVLLPAARALDALLLGEQEAAYLGVAVKRLRQRVVLATALAVGAAVAAAGVIGFIGLIVPHLVRLIAGPRHQVVLVAAALLGAALLLLADAVARTVAAPIELPIGLVTSALGGPFFIALLIRQGRAAA